MQDGSIKNLSSSYNSGNITIRSIMIGLVLVVINAYWIAISSELWYSVFTAVSLFFNTIFCLFIIIQINFLIKILLPKKAFTWQELAIMYIMMCMVSTISGHTMMMYLVGALAHPYWFATPENEWQSLFWQYIPDWVTVSDKAVLTDYFQGESSFYHVRYIKAWLVPMLAWSAFTFVLFSTLLCINVIIRKRWMEQERLAYPLVQLPVEMLNSNSFFRNRLLWIGFAVSGTITLINGLNIWVPSVPVIPVKCRDISPYFTSKPWDAMGVTLIDFHPFIIGLAYFIPLDLSFSCWFFYILTKVEKIITSSIGWNNLYLDERSVSAWIMLGLLTIYTGRKHLFEAVKQIFTKKDRQYEAKEPIKYRTAVTLTIIGLSFIAIFCYAAGMSLWAIGIFFAVYIAMALGITRVRAALGAPYHEVVFVYQRQFMIGVLGSRRIGPANLTMMSFLYPFTRCHRSHPMPTQLESLKIAQQGNMLNGRLIGAMMGSIALGAIASFWIYLTIAYKYGASAGLHGWLAGFGWESFNPLQSWLSHPTGTNTTAVAFMGGNASFVMFLMAMHRRFTWWMLHPAGYVLSGGSWSGMFYIWNAILISWAIKYMILKFGGFKAYAKGRPFFFGLVLGDYMIGCLWNILGLIFNMPAYSIW